MKRAALGVLLAAAGIALFGTRSWSFAAPGAGLLAGGAMLLGVVVAERWLRVDDGAYARLMAETAINDGANLVQADELCLQAAGQQGEDFVNVVAAAMFTCLRHPDMEALTLDDALNENWADSDFDRSEFDEAAEWVRSWFDGSHD